MYLTLQCVADQHLGGAFHHAVQHETDCRDLLSQGFWQKFHRILAKTLFLVLGGQLAVAVDEPVHGQHVHDVTRLVLAERHVSQARILRTELVGRNACLGEERIVDDDWPLSQVGLDVPLQAFGEPLVAFRRDHGQQVHIKEFRIAEQVAVLAHALAVHAQAQSAANLLSFADFVVRMLQRADLEHVGIVPSLAQRGMAEDEPRGLFEAQQAFLVLQNQVVCADVVAVLRPAFDLRVDGMAVLVDAEISLVHVTAVRGAQPVEIAGSVVETVLDEIMHAAVVLLLEHVRVLAVQRLAVIVVPAVFRHLVDEEQAQALDAPGPQMLLLVQVGEDGLADLHAAHVRLGPVVHDPALAERLAVHEPHVAGPSRLQTVGHDAVGRYAPAVAVRLQFAG